MMKQWDMGGGTIFSDKPIDLVVPDTTFFIGCHPITT